MIENKNEEQSKQKLEFKYNRRCKLFCKRFKGNEYFLKADEGVIDQNDSNYIYLTSVNGVINLKNYRMIEISSEFGKYNINNYDTIFSKCNNYLP